jgi:hypothetical protein
MEIRLDTDSEEDDIIDEVSALHDTGSDIMSIFDIDLARMGNMARLSRVFGGFLSVCSDAEGRVEKLPMLSNQVRFCRCKTRSVGLAGLTKTRLSG